MHLSAAKDLGFAFKSCKDFVPRLFRKQRDNEAESGQSNGVQCEMGLRWDFDIVRGRACLCFIYQSHR